MDMGIEAAGGDDLALAGNRLGARADDDVDAGLDVRVAGLADGMDAAVLEPDIGLDDAPVIEDQGVGDTGIDGALGIGHQIAQASFRERVWPYVWIAVGAGPLKKKN